MPTRLMVFRGAPTATVFDQAELILRLTERGEWVVEKNRTGESRQTLTDAAALELIRNESEEETR